MFLQNVNIYSHVCQFQNLKNLFTGILVDNETDNPIQPPQAITDSYEELMLTSQEQLAKFLDPQTPLHEGAPIPVKEIDGVK